MIKKFKFEQVDLRDCFIPIAAKSMGVFYCLLSVALYLKRYFIIVFTRCLNTVFALVRW